jgi:hypothetical protein
MQHTFDHLNRTFKLMAFPFGKKKTDSAQTDLDKSKRSLEEIEANTTVLDKDEMLHLKGSKETTRTLPNINDLRNSLGDTIPL